MRLSDRLEAILTQLAMYPGHTCLADVGCDHGFACIEAVHRGCVSRAIAMDLREGPLQRADLHIRSCPDPEAFEIRLSDGLDALLPGQADVILISGMGGDLMSRILERGRQTAMAADLVILQPQKDVSVLRRFLAEDYELLSEDFICEDGKYYFIMTLRPHPGYRAGYTDAELEYGRLLLAQRNPVLLGYLRKLHGKQAAVVEAIRDHSDQTSKRAAEMQHMLDITTEALALYQEESDES